MIPIVGKAVNPRTYLSSIKKMYWSPTGITLHNTSVPDISDRPNGFTESHMRNLAGYYTGQGWKSGPSFFVDQNKIWAFSPIERRGTHSPSFNTKYIGVEMLGEYTSDSFDSGDGAKIRANAVLLMAELCIHFGFNPETDIKLHKEDKKTTHKTCPGKHVIKSEVISEVKDMIEKLNGTEAPVIDTKIIIYKKGFGHDPYKVIKGVFKSSKNLADAKEMNDATGLFAGLTGLVEIGDTLRAKYNLVWHGEENKLYCVEK